MSITVQTPEELRTNVAAFKRMLGEKTRINLIPEEGMTPEQLAQCRHNATAFDIRMSALYTGDDGRTDYSIANIAAAYKFLRDNSMLKFEVAPEVRKSPNVLTDDRGRIVRNLKAEREDQARRDAEEAAQSRNNRTFEGELKRLEAVAQVNKTIEATRDEIASFRGPSHSKTYAVREKATEILESAIQNDRTLGGIATAASDIRLLMKKAWD